MLRSERGTLVVEILLSLYLFSLLLFWGSTLLQTLERRQNALYQNRNRAVDALRRP